MPQHFPSAANMGSAPRTGHCDPATAKRGKQILVSSGNLLVALELDISATINANNREVYLHMAAAEQVNRSRIGAFPIMSRSSHDAWSFNFELIHEK